MLIKYRGEAESFQFQMFEGLSLILKEEFPRIFEGEIYIPDLDDGIFTYDFILNKKNKSGEMTKIELDKKWVLLLKYQ